MTAIKTALGVRNTTPNDTCLIEIGMPSLTALIQDKQFSFYEKHIKNRNVEGEDPLSLAIYLNREENTPAWKYIEKILQMLDIIHLYIEKRKTRILVSTKT